MEGERATDEWKKRLYKYVSECSGMSVWISNNSNESNQTFPLKSIYWVFAIPSRLPSCGTSRHPKIMIHTYINRQLWFRPFPLNVPTTILPPDKVDW